MAALGFCDLPRQPRRLQDSYLPSGQPSGTPEEALDCACGLYLGDPAPGSQRPLHQVELGGFGPCFDGADHWAGAV